jgi:flagellar biosynthetic protein FliP
MRARRSWFWGGLAGALIVLPLPALAQASGAFDLATRALGSATGGAHPGDPLSLPLQLLILMGLLAILPSMLLMMTAFTRIIIVLAILRQALGLTQSPPNQVLVGLALFLTFFVMSPTLTKVNAEAVTPYSQGTLPLAPALDRGGAVLHKFMIAQTRRADLMLFANMAHAPRFAAPADVPFSILLPAYVTSELKTAFQIGFMLFLPFLIVDLVVASVLMALGMMMLSPTLISLPFKLLLFVLVDGWALTMGSLAGSFRQVAP